MNSDTVSITAIGSISPLGSSLEESWENYVDSKSVITRSTIGDKQELVAKIPNASRVAIDQLKSEDSKYKDLDDSVLFAIYAARLAFRDAGWGGNDNFGVNIGSSRGATALFENYHKNFLEHRTAALLSSPTTTLGNISSWIAHDLNSKGPEISHSITCSTALHALLNGMAWLKSGMCDKFLVGGSEAALTSFTIAQMKALRVYAKSINDYPCKALDLEKRTNTMVLGEGASVVCLEKGVQDNTLAVIKGIGYATEPLTHNISISTDADCFQKSMKMALGDLNPDKVDVIVMHAPGTVKGDLSEFNAIKKVFCNKTPALTTNKWKVGHTFGASGMLSVEMAILMIQHQQFIKVPFIDYEETPEKIRNVLINAVGFGGNAVSVLLSDE